MEIETYEGSKAKLARELNIAPSTVFTSIQRGEIKEKIKRNQKGQKVKYLEMPRSFMDAMRIQGMRRFALKKAREEAKKRIKTVAKKKNWNVDVDRIPARYVPKIIALIDKKEYGEAKRMIAHHD